MSYDRDSYRREAEKVRGDAVWTGKKYLPVGILFLVVIAAVLWLLSLASQPARIASKVADADNVISNYEEFQTIYNTTQKLNQDLCNMRKLPADDQMFHDFSKAQRINALQANMNRWIEEYNAKSKMFTRQMWKSRDLPYQLSTADFSCYEGGGQ